MNTTEANPKDHPQYGAKRKVKAKRLVDNIHPKDMRFALRVKIKTLAAEAHIIRREERHTRSLAQYTKLHTHRVHNVRIATRCSGLALSFIKGKKLREIEMEGSKPLRLEEVRSIYEMVRKYGNPHITMSEIIHWVQGT